MSNRTQDRHRTVHGVDPQLLVEKVIRERIYESSYYNEHLFIINAASLIEKVIALDHIGGTYSNTRPTEFLCCLLALLKINPEKEILVEYLQAKEFKYLRALAAFYVRMTFRSIEVYELLEPMLADYRKLRYKDDQGWHITYMDEFIDHLLTEERVCSLILPRLTQRRILEESNDLKPYKSALETEQSIPKKRKNHSSSEDSDDDEDSEIIRNRFVSRSPTPHDGSDGEISRPRYISRSPSPNDIP